MDLGILFFRAFLKFRHEFHIGVNVGVGIHVIRLRWRSIYLSPSSGRLRQVLLFEGDHSAKTLMLCKMLRTIVPAILLTIVTSELPNRQVKSLTFVKIISIWRNLSRKRGLSDAY